MSNNPTQKKQWANLQKLADQNLSLNDLFQENKNRFNEFSIEENGLFLDYSKQRINKDILNELFALLNSSEFNEKRDAMFAGKKINHTEDRAVLHTALRDPSSTTICVDGKNVVPDIQQTLSHIEKISNDVRNGTYKGATGKPIDHVVAIGIGGSDLGPRMAYEALNDGSQNVTLSFVSNIDAHDIEKTLQSSMPETTLFIVISKSFNTQDTLINARTAHKWAENALGKNVDLTPHFIAVSSNIEAARKFGIHSDNIYPMWNWVNGRFSLWSAVGLPLAIGLGFDVFNQLLQGARAMDVHFQESVPENNLPVLTALIGIWNRNFLNLPHHAILPYAQQLSHFPAYLQQLEMESNGKQTDNEGHTITDYKTGAVLFGEAGTNGQHSFYQFLHQGSEIVPCDFIGVLKPNHSHKNHHDLLMGHMLAQGQAMMQGKGSPENAHKHFSGNIPSTTILIETLDAYHLGMLVALYEHKVFVQGVIWNINSFDQFGVELGKEMAKNIEENDLDSLDPSTRGLYSRIHKPSK